jgi:outer membrane protein
MKHFNPIALIILSIAVIGLYVLHFTSKDKNTAFPVKKESFTAGISEIDSFPIAYVNVDSILLNYQFIKEMNEVLLKKQEKFENDITKKQRDLQKDFVAFQQKYESGGFLTKKSFEQEQQRLLKKEQELQELDRRLTQELFTEQQKVNTQLRDTISHFFKIYNEDKHYKLILSDTRNDNIFYAENYMNITNEVVQQLNARYKSNK